MTDRLVANHLEQRRVRSEYEGAMPKRPTRQDEVGRHVRDEEADRDASTNPRAENPRIEGVLMRRYLKQAVEGNERDEQTLHWMLENNDEEVPYEAIAERTGIPLGTVHWRVHDFKERYFPKYTRWRNNGALLLLLLLLGAVVFWATRPPAARKLEPIQPAPEFRWTAPSASASTAPPEPGPPPRFDNAQPTQPPPRLKP